MAVQTITYDDKSYLNQNQDIAAVNKCNDTDMNEIKSVVNNNATELSNVITINQTYATASYAGAAIAGSTNPFNGFNTFASHGNLTTSSTGVTIGSGINAVLVSAGLELQNATNSYDLISAGIIQNSTTLVSMYNEVRNSNGSQGFITLPTTVVTVQEGDTISVFGNGEVSTNIRRANLTVKALY